MRIPYGTSNFGDIRREGYFYVDKTPFLPVLESRGLGHANLVFLRPRRMGKSSLISMMEYYYDLSWASEFDELFRGLWIHEHPTPEKNKYLVLTLDFSQSSAGGSQEALERGFLEATQSSVITLALRYRDRIPEIGRLYDQLNNFRSAPGLMAHLLGIVAGIKQKLYILIDEYDTFANDLLSAGQTDLYSSVTAKTGFVREFYRTIKIGTRTGAVARLFVTGATPILLDDLTTGFNIVANISNRARFNELAGFTRADVMRAVDELCASRPDLGAIAELGDRQALLAALEQSYDGYRFSEDAEQRVFNSDLVLYFLREVADLGKYPAKMLDPNARTDYRKLHSIWVASGPAAEERRKILETILGDGYVRSELIEQFGRSGPSTTSQFVSLMYYTGMLTLSPEPPRGNEHRFEVPNRVIRELGWEHFAWLLEELEGIELRAEPMSAAQYEMAASGNIAPFLEVFRNKVLKALGVKDLRKFNEKALKMLLLPCFILTRIFHVISELEFAQGFCDLFLSPTKNLPHAKYAWMLEIKYLPATADADELDKAFKQAEQQLQRYTSDPELMPALTRGLELKAGTLVFVSCKDVVFRAMATS